jgi:hypothetical protein
MNQPVDWQAIAIFVIAMIALKKIADVWAMQEIIQHNRPKNKSARSKPDADDKEKDDRRVLHFGNGSVFRRVLGLRSRLP